MIKVNYNQLKKDISENKFYNIYLLQGEDYIVKYFEKTLIDKFLGKNVNDFDLVVFNAENLNCANLYAAMESLPLKASKKCIVIHDLPFENWGLEETDEFSNIILDIPDFVCLIICQHSAVSGAKSAAKLKKIQKNLPENAVSATFSKKDIPIENQLVRWAKQDYGKELSLDFAKQINELCSEHNLTSLKNELKKICEFEPSGVISQNALEILISSRVKPSVFDLPKAILSKNHEKAFKLLDDLLAGGEDPVAILAIIAAQYIDIYRVKTYVNGGEPISELSKIYDYSKKEFRLNNAARICNQMDAFKIKNCLKFLIETDEKLKSTQLKPKFVLSQLIAKLIIYG